MQPHQSVILFVVVARAPDALIGATMRNRGIVERRHQRVALAGERGQIHCGFQQRTHVSFRIQRAVESGDARVAPADRGQNLAAVYARDNYRAFQSAERLATLGVILFNLL
jgi:hypothetical protein